MARIEKTVFISYRRADEPWALAVFENLTQVWLRRIHRLRWHCQREFRDCHIGEHKSAGTLSCPADSHRTGASQRSSGLDAP